MDLLINGLEKSPSRLSECYIILYSSVQKTGSFLAPDYNACVSESIKTNEHAGIIFAGIIP